MTIQLTRGDLLKAPVEALVNTVNTLGVMGKGLALQFKNAFPSSAADYSRKAKMGKVHIGKVVVTKVGTLWVMHFPTKADWRDPSELAYIDAGLISLVSEVSYFRIRSIAIPALGCGCGGLAWSDVRPRIEKAFAALPDVKVMLYEPA